MEVTLLICWFGCLSRYLASPNQKLIKQPIQPGLGWAGFLFFNGIAYYMLRLHWGALSSGLTLLAIGMMCWISIVLINGHASLKRLPFLLLALLSASYLLRLG